MPAPRVLWERGEADARFLDNLAAAVKLKGNLVERGINVDSNVLDQLAEFQSPQGSDETKATAMAGCPTAVARALLDRIILSLAQASDGPTLSEFRENKVEFDKTKSNVRNILMWSGLAFIALLFLALIIPPFYNRARILGVVVWAASLGGIGAVSGQIVQILGMSRHESVRMEDTYFVTIRIFLGVAFSLVLTTILVADDLMKFFSFLASRSGGVAAPEPRSGGGGTGIRTGMLLLPFLCGYSIPFVLGLLDKAMEAIQLTIGMELRGPSKATRGRVK